MWEALRPNTWQEVTVNKITFFSQFKFLFSIIPPGRNNKVCLFQGLIASPEPLRRVPLCRSVCKATGLRTPSPSPPPPVPPQPSAPSLPTRALTTRSFTSRAVASATPPALLRSVTIQLSVFKHSFSTAGVLTLLKRRF